MDGDTLYSIGEMARRTGLTVKTIRFYSDHGIVAPTDRSPAGYRLYNIDAVARLDLVRTLRDLGLDLPTIQKVMDGELSLPEVAAASRGGVRLAGPASGGNVAAYDQLVNAAVTLHAGATPSAPALVLRPWCVEDVAALVEVYQDSALRHWTSTAVENGADGARWVQAQQRGWASGGQFGFAVLEAQSDLVHGQLAGNVVLKEVASGKPSAEVGYWTAAHARGRGVAPRALDVLTSWAFDTFGADGLERLELLHQEDNLASCRVAQKSGYEFDRVLPAAPPSFPLDGHLHIRHTDS
jgi:DNA-binding transcriptional MerR regulator